MFECLGIPQLTYMQCGLENLKGTVSQDVSGNFYGCRNEKTVFFLLYSVRKHDVFCCLKSLEK